MKIDLFTQKITPAYNKIKKKSISTYNYGSAQVSQNYHKAKDYYQSCRKKYKGLPAIMAAAGLVVPVPLASVLGFALGVGIVKIKEHIKNKSLNKP